VKLFLSRCVVLSQDNSGWSSLVGEVSTGNGYSHRWERNNGEFWVTVGSNILVQSVKGAGC